jgi:hypothetical protein
VRAKMTHAEANISGFVLFVGEVIWFHFVTHIWWTQGIAGVACGLIARDVLIRRRVRRVVRD